MSKASLLSICITPSPLNCPPKINSSEPVNPVLGLSGAYGLGEVDHGPVGRSSGVVRQLIGILEVQDAKAGGERWIRVSSSIENGAVR